MRAYVAVTDYDWFRDLRDQRPPVDEVNFWQPGGQRLFRALAPGELFLFKLHSPRNYVVGGGFLAATSLLPVTLAWDTFGRKNGARSLLEMRERVARYRRAVADPRADYTVGCIVLAEPFFLDERDWIPVPLDFQLNTVQGKTYDLTAGTGRALYDTVQARLATLRPTVVTAVHEPTPPGAVPHALILARRRLGQGAFRVLVTDSYERRCAVTGERTLPVLDAAHIRPVASGGEHQADNGLLLRSDIHTLFDRGYVAVTADHRFEVSRRLREDFENGRHYYALAGTPVRVPAAPERRPAPHLLTWHAEHVFLG